jgi:hypothetical protein
MVLGIHIYVVASAASRLRHLTQSSWAVLLVAVVHQLAARISGGSGRNRRHRKSVFVGRRKSSDRRSGVSLIKRFVFRRH